jgi:NAD(P)-dependent dehydrogenase (short-subunit alcohol dehydrogenase family)
VVQRRDGPVASTDADVWRATLEIVVVAAATMCRLVIPHMVEAGRGSIVNVSSRAAARGTPGVSAYSSAKAGLEALARSITVDYARAGVRCNVVRPGYIVHGERDKAMAPERRERYEAMHLTRLPTAEDVANAVVFLASRDAEVITGVTLPVDGGSSAVRGTTLG